MLKNIIFLSITIHFFTQFMFINCCEDKKIENREILFKEFIEKYKITYRTDKEMLDAKKTFETNLTKVIFRNCKQDNSCIKEKPFTHELAINKFFDLTSEDLKKNFYKIYYEENSYGYKHFEKFNSDISYSIPILQGNILSKITNYLLTLLNFSSSNNSEEVIDKNIIPIFISDNKENTSYNKIKKGKKILFDWRNKHIFKTIDPFEENNENENSQLEKKYKKDVFESNSSFKIPSNNIENFKWNFNPFKMMNFHNSFLWQTFSSDNQIREYKKFYAYMKYTTNEDLEFILKNIGPIYIEVMASGIEIFAKGIFDPYSCEYYKYNLGTAGVFLVGYGKENDNEFWIAKSTFGNDWGEEKGYFRILKNKNDDIFEYKKFIIVLKIHEI